MTALDGFDLWFVLNSVFVGLLPEVLYFTLFISFVKQLKRCRVALFFLILVANLILSALFAFSIWYHVLFMPAMLGIMWVLYRKIDRVHISDLFIITLACIILGILNTVLYFSIPNYWVATFAGRIIMLAIPLVFRARLVRLYGAYQCSWDRRPDSKIKSLTVRNMCAVSLNAFLFFANLAMVYWAQNHIAAVYM